MATNFLIALAVALGSATLILLVLRIGLKFMAPKAFAEMIQKSEKVVGKPAATSFIVPNLPSSAVIYNLTFQPPQDALSGIQIANLLRQEQTPLIMLSGTWPQSATKAKRQKKVTASIEEVLSPPGQQSSNLGLSH
jgi:hypothetical protein